MAFLLECMSKGPCAVLPQKHHDAFVWNGKWLPGAEETHMGSSSNPRDSSLAWPPNRCQKPELLFTVLTENRAKLCSCCGERDQLCWQQRSVCSWGAAGFSPVSKVLCLFWNSDKVSAALQTTLLLCQYKTLPPPGSASVWTPLPASAFVWWVGGERFPFAKLPL